MRYEQNYERIQDDWKEANDRDCIDNDFDNIDGNDSTKAYRYKWSEEDIDISQVKLKCIPIIAKLAILITQFKCI